MSGGTRETGGERASAAPIDSGVDAGAGSADALAAERFTADLTLARAARGGDAQALARLAERLRSIPRVLAILNGRVGRPFGAEDLADLSQEILVLVWQKLETFEGRATLETWSQRFCFHLFMNRLRQMRRSAGPRAEFVDLETLGAAPSDARELGDYERLESLLAELGPPASEVLRLKHYDDLTFEDIGRLLGVSPNTVKTQYYRGLQWLRERLESTRGSAEGGA